MGEGGTSNMASISDAEADTIRTPSRRSPSKVERTQSSMGNERRVYDIPTLLSIGRRLGSKSDPVVLNVIPDAAPVGRRRDETGVLKEKVLNRPHRACSGSSSGSSTMQDSVRRASHRVPSRQPVNPPHGSLAQANAGFAKFLKEHTSPKHQRVTAGGRIVPFEVDPKPAPEFKLPIRKAENHSKTSRDCSRKGLGNHGRPKAEPLSGPSHDRLSQQKAQGVAAAGLSPFDSVATAEQQSANADSNPSSRRQKQQQQQQQHASFPNPAAPLFQPSSETIASLANPFQYSNTAVDASTWPMAPFLSNMSQPPVPPYLPASMYGFGVPPCTAPFAIQAPGQLYPIPPAAGVVGNGMLGAPPILPSPTSMQDWATPQALDDATKEYESISKELEDLDRYLAMRFQIDPTAKRILVEQRVELVEKKNAARSSKELIETALQTLAKQANNSQDNSQQDPQQQQQPVSEGAAPFMNGFCGQVPPWAPTFIPNPMNIPSTASGYVPPIPNQTPLLNPYQAAAPSINAMPGTANQILAYQSDEYSPRETSRSKASQAAVSAGISAVDRGERWDKASENAPPEIMRVYHNLENAVKTGANLEPHLRELSTAILSLKHKKSVLQRSRESSKDMSKDRGTSKTKANGQEAANPPGVTEQAQGDRSGKKPAAKENNEKRRFRKKKEVRQKSKDSKASAAATTSGVTEDSREQGSPVLEAEEAKTTSQNEPTPISANSPEQSKIPGNSRASQVRYTAETFTPLAQQLEAQVKASESSAEGTNGMKNWTPTVTCDEENDQRRPRSSGEESTKTKESSSGRFFGWFRRALSPSPESQAAKSLAQNLKQTGREAKKAQNEGKHGQRARIFSQ